MLLIAFKFLRLIWMWTGTFKYSIPLWSTRDGCLSINHVWSYCSFDLCGRITTKMRRESQLKPYMVILQFLQAFGARLINYCGVNRIKIKANVLSMWLRWDVAVSREAAGVYQPGNSTTARDPETHWQSYTQCKDGAMKTLRRCLLSKSCIFHCQYIFF